MKKYILIISIMFLFFSIPIHVHSQQQSIQRRVAHPEIPRGSASEAYVKYKSGKALIFHGGGEKYSKRHILGAYQLDVPDEMMDRILVKFPKEGIEIFTYCY